MSLFNLNWRTQAKNLLPSFKRSTSLLDFLTSLLEPLTTKASEWLTFDNEIKKRAKFNAQIIVLRAALNDIFGLTGIEIVTNQGIGSHLYFYNSVEGLDPTYFSNATEDSVVYFFNTSEIPEGDNFTIKIPTSDYNTELDRRIQAEVRIYKLSGKTFNTEQY